MPMSSSPTTLSTAQRISVVGTTGAGKTTIARALATRLGLPHVELDSLSWGPNWTSASPEVFRARVRAAAAEPRWVCDGNYSAVRSEVWSRADTVVWLDYSFGVVFGRLLRRTFQRWWHAEEMWAGNRETLRNTFLSRDSILWWAISTYSRRRAAYPGLLALPEYGHLRVIHVRSPYQAERLLEALARADGAPRTRL